LGFLLFIYKFAARPRSKYFLILISAIFTGETLKIFHISVFFQLTTTCCCKLNFNIFAFLDLMA